MATKRASKSKSARNKTVYRLNSTGLLISKKKALKLDPALYTVEKMATSGNKPVRTRTVYRNSATGQLITKAEALKLAADAYTVEELPFPPTHPFVTDGLNIDLTGNWGEAPVITVDKGSNEKRGTVRIKAGNGATGTAGWTMTFRHPKHAAPFAIVNCQHAARECSNDTTKEDLTVVSSAYDSAAGVAFDYLVTD